MKRSLTLGLVAAALTFGTVTAHAAVNCDQVNKYLKTGRTPQDVADTMVVPIDDIKKCQAGGDIKAKAAGSAMPSGQPGGTTAMPDGSKGN
jgi:hypothetical protein